LNAFEAVCLKIVPERSNMSRKKAFFSALVTAETDDAGRGERVNCLRRSFVRAGAVAKISAHVSFGREKNRTPFFAKAGKYGVLDVVWGLRIVMAAIRFDERMKIFEEILKW